QGSVRSATMTLRVPSEKAEQFLGELERLGELVTRQETVRDVGKEFHDAEILLHNLEAASRRYEEILARAANVQEVLQVEEQLNRIRAEIDRVKGELGWMRDRTSRATVHVAFEQQTVEVAEMPLPKTPKLYPGLDVAYLADWGSKRDAQFLNG